MKSLCILTFRKSDGDWLRFVVKNRKGKIIENNYDMIIGPVADDQTAPVIDLFLDGMYDEEEAMRLFLTSETHRMLEDADLAMWEFSARAIFDMWEVEQVTGDPRNSQHLRSEG